MSLLARHRFMANRLMEAFGYKDEDEIDAMLREPDCLAKINFFFTADGPSKIIISEEIISSTGGSNEAVKIGQKDERAKMLVVYSNDVTILPNVAVYFMKNKNKKGDYHYDIDPTKINDGCLSYGVIRKPLESFDALMRNVYKPLIEESETIKWGEASGEQKNEFMHGIDIFTRNLQSSIRSLSGGLELQSPDGRLEAMGANAMNDPSLVISSMNLLHEWCRSIENYLDDSDRTRWETPDSGPDTELNYWRSRMQRLNSITEQLKGKSVKSVISLLSMIMRAPDLDASIDTHRVMALLSQWREIDVQITEAANEAKDNVKYLSTLERFFEPLFGADPQAVIDTLQPLLNAVKMIHTIARYFGTTERMTKLFMKITNQMIATCKQAINGRDSPDKIWDKDLSFLLQVIEKCLQMNEEYQDQYRMTKEKLMTTPKGKQFDFSEAQIFGKFDLFCRRLIKLMDMFSTMQQFNTLAQQKFEGLNPLLRNFDEIVKSFRSKGYDLLDFHSNRFDRDYVDFNVKMNELERSLQHYINRSFENVGSIESSLSLLKKYQEILHRENLRSDLDSKLSVIFHNYGQELTRVEQIYEKFKHNPPISRNMPPVAGNIAWARHLLRKIEEPMKRFQGNPAVLASKESKRVVRTYNKVARTLIAFEYLWYEAWCGSIDAAKAGLQATVVIRHPETGKLYVNFDLELFQLIRETKCLVKLEIDIPEAAKIVLLQEQKYKSYYNDLKYMLSEYERITQRIIPVTQKLLEPHLRTMEMKLRPGMITLTWTSMNIDAYKAQIQSGLTKLEDLVNKINDIVENRVQKNLKQISRTVLVSLPEGRTLALDEFVTMQEGSVKDATGLLTMKNVEVENAVHDLVSILKNTHTDSAVEPVDTADIVDMQNHFSSLTYQALLNCVKVSLNLIKKRACSRVGAGILFKQEPFFEVDVQLSVPSVRLSPSLDDIQRSINRSSVAVLGSAKKMMQWNQQGIPEKDCLSFFDLLGLDVEIVKTVLLLTGGMHGTRNSVHEYLKDFAKYDWLWKDEKEQTYKRFIATNPSIADFEARMKHFLLLEEEIDAIVPTYSIGALLLNTKNLKTQLSIHTRQWKLLFSNKVHQLAKDQMNNLYEYMRSIKLQLNTEVQDLSTLRYVVGVLKEVREKESSIQLDCAPVLEMYAMLEFYLSDGVIDKEEVEQRQNMIANWRNVVETADRVSNNLIEIQGGYKKQLIWDVKDFSMDIKNMRQEFEENGPLKPGIAPARAVELLKKFKNELDSRERKMETYRAGEELFALRPTKFNEVTKTRKDVNLVDMLYSLYTDVQGSINGWSGLLWTEVADQVNSMTDVANNYEARLKKLPKKLREWPAYADVSQQIVDLQVLLPLLTEMSKPSMKPRHWIELSQIVGQNGKKLPYDQEGFSLQHLIESGISQFKDEVEEICDGADKQLQIETKMNETKDFWATAVFEFVMWKTRDVPVLKAFGVVIEELEEAQLLLQTLLSVRHVAPFREDVQKFLTMLSDTADTLELWVKVQMLWSSLESVFMGGDIAKQMPVEAKKFQKINKDWEKLMVRSAETRLVINCCNNELLKTTLPALYGELEKCQKSLEGYLEQKRGKFPRFYFVSNPVLLLILSQGSDPMQMQPYYEKVFDSIDRVTHNKSDKSQIIDISSSIGSAKEVVILDNFVKAVGNIEDWLGVLESEMQRSLKRLCEQSAMECVVQPIRQFADKFQGQFSLLGLQISWTVQCNDALTNAKANKQIMVETNKFQLSVLQDLSGWCLEDLGSKMNRIKVETLVTIQVHQRDVFADLVRLFKERKLTDANDFEWLKQSRFTWNPASSDRHGPGACVIAICDVEYKYNNEYLGCKERLVVTPLTDRCFIALSQAMGMCLGGAPAGPAGTGKTETVKDMGRALGVFVVVTNCTDQQRFTDMARIFKGLCQAGLWGCFDEFNRIELPVLSVVAQQVLAITNARRTQASEFTFPGDTKSINIKLSVGYFITMNPGYAGRQELPENLKALFRGVTMMVPDREIIIKVKLCSVGYNDFPNLARKFTVLYNLCEQQLSKQKHYDFGLRNILSVLRTAGKTKRDKINDPEEALLMSTLRDMNLSKLVAQDVPLFLSLLSDLFPALGMPPGLPHVAVNNALAEIAQKDGLILHPSWSIKVIQLYETTLVRHGIMTVGPSGSGKSMIIRCLQDCLTKSTGITHKRTRMNPKAIRAEEMFGETDKLTQEWVDGIFAVMWAKFNDKNRKDIHWIICDGPVDALWIENLNTVLDDNKILTLANGDRIPMTDNVKLMMEVEDLRNASPATVSRAGIIYVSESDLDWEPILKSWLLTKSKLQSETFGELFKRCVGTCTGPKSFGHLFAFFNKNLKPVMTITRVGMIEGMLHLLDGLLSVSDLAPESSAAQLAVELERLFIYSLTWAVGGLCESEDRAKFSDYVMQLSEVGVPTLKEQSDTLFEYRVNPDSMEWERWKAPEWEYPHDVEEPNFSNMLVPTIETTRSLFIIDNLQKKKNPVLMTGSSGTAKSAVAAMFFDIIKSDDMRVKNINFSSATPPAGFQVSLEAELDKRSGKNFGPPGNKKMTVFLDDMSMPERNVWGDQPTLEFGRQLIETNGFCFLDKDKRGDLKTVEDLIYIAAMGHPGGGRQDIPNRLKRHFFVFNMILPSNQAINEIYGQMLNGRFHMAGPFLTAIIQNLCNATINLWQWMRTKMLPSPSKFHYTFNLRDLSRSFMGVLRTPIASITDCTVFMRLWRHECERVFCDKLTVNEDKALFMNQLDINTRELLALGDNPSVKAAMSRPAVTTSGNKFSKGKGGTKGPPAATVKDCVVSFESLKEEEEYFVDFLREDEYDEDGVLVQEAPKIYELGGNMDTMRTRVYEFLERYNDANASKRLDIILFDDAMRHLMRITRVLGMPKGSILLVGVGGSGKQSLTKLGAYCANQNIFQITISKTYNMNNLMDDIRAIYKTCGSLGQKLTFLFTEAEIKEESFMEVINSILTTGEVANLFPKEELMGMASELRNIAVKSAPGFVDTADNLVKFFIDRVRNNLHCVLCMSPVSAKFSERARRFPGIIAGCTIDWFLPWPKEALVAVSKGYISKVELHCETSVKESLIVHMGLVHKIIVDACDDYFTQMRRHVYQTPKSFLQFLSDYSGMYKQKCDEIDIKSSRVEIGLEKLASGAKDVEKMKIVLAQEEIKLKESEKATNEMLGKLEKSSMEAKKEADAVSKIKDACQKDASRIAGEKAIAEEQLSKAQPFVDQAENAVNSIKPNDLNELKKLGNPSPIIKLIFDVVAILKKAPIIKAAEPVEISLGVGKDKKTIPFIKDSYPMQQKGMLADTRFLQHIMHFSAVEKDFINDETIEFMKPYLNLDGYAPAVAKNASKAAEGLCIWSRAMADYHEASKIVKPRLEALRVAEARLQDAERDLFKAESRLKACQDVLNGLQRDFDSQLATKRAIEENAIKTRNRMNQATSLISGLSGERERWTDDRNMFADTKLRLVGDVALACAFVSYCGPFNQEFRAHLVTRALTDDLKQREIPLSDSVDLTDFLADVGTIGDWNLQGLPTDTLSIQNGILVTRSNRYPLLIDPQGQAINWICNHEDQKMPYFGVTTFTNNRFRDQLEHCMAEGKAMIIIGVEQEIDPVLTPVLEKQISVKSKSKSITVGGKVCDYVDEFMMYLVTRLPNPHFSPEDQSRCTIVDFTVTQKGLEEQLLGRVIQKEQRSLEESLKSVLEEVTNNTKALLKLDQMLLERLSENTGNLLDDDELISVLADTKSKSTDVKEKLVAAAAMKKNINEKREQYRPVATRGSVLYFSVVDMSNVNSMYQTSLDQFQFQFDKSMDQAEKASLASKRVNNIITSMTYITYRYIQRGLYEIDKVSFKLIVLFKTLLTANKLNSSGINVFLRGGGALNINSVQAKPFKWLTDDAWLNVVQLGMSYPLFKSITQDIIGNEGTILNWYNENEPEKFPVPIIEPKLPQDDEVLVAFHRLLLVRCLRVDRTLLAVNDFIRTTESVDINGVRLPVMGPLYTEPATDTVESILEEMNSTTPVIYLLSAGADPTDSIETIARKRRKGIECVSMGEGQDVVAAAAIATASAQGSWVLLQNCHLGLDFIDTLEDVVNELKLPDSGCSPDFRLFISTEPHAKFSIGALQMSTKVTNEPPKGMRAGLQRSYTVMVDQDRLERIETTTWRSLVYALCFIHSSVQERRKFGPLGWCVPYEFNDGDLNASIMFLEKHLESGILSWTTLQYMTGEVQYGGRITDNIDRRLFMAYAEAWLSANTLAPSFSFSPDHPINHQQKPFQYKIPQCLEVGEYMGYINQFPDVDSPEVLGLHPNADLTFRFQEVQNLLDTILETQPKQSSSTGGGKTREELVFEKCEELIDTVPDDYIEDEYEERISSLGGLSVPLNIFLYQEVQRLQMAIDKVNGLLKIVMQAIKGEIVVTAEIMDAINAINDARVPKSWLYSPAGDELSWLSPSLGSWYAGLIERNDQYRRWLDKGRPSSFWLTGFFNPQGYLTAVQQEITRAHKNDNWALDSVVIHAEVTDIMNPDNVHGLPKVSDLP